MKHISNWICEGFESCWPAVQRLCASYTVWLQRIHHGQKAKQKGLIRILSGYWLRKKPPLCWNCTNLLKVASVSRNESFLTDSKLTPVGSLLPNRSHHLQQAEKKCWDSPQQVGVGAALCLPYFIMNKVVKLQKKWKLWRWRAAALCWCSAVGPGVSFSLRMTIDTFLYPVKFRPAQFGMGGGGSMSINNVSFVWHLPGDCSHPECIITPAWLVHLSYWAEHHVTLIPTVPSPGQNRRPPPQLYRIKVPTLQMFRRVMAVGVLACWCCCGWSLSFTSFVFRHVSKF